MIFTRIFAITVLALLCSAFQILALAVSGESSNSLTLEKRGKNAAGLCGQQCSNGSCDRKCDETCKSFKNITLILGCEQKPVKIETCKNNECNLNYIILLIQGITTSDLIGVTLYGSVFREDALQDWIKIDGVILGQSSLLRLEHTKDIGSYLRAAAREPNVVAVAYQIQTGKVYVSSGINTKDGVDTKSNGGFTTYILRNKAL